MSNYKIHAPQMVLDKVESTETRTGVELGGSFWQNHIPFVALWPYCPLQLLLTVPFPHSVSLQENVSGHCIHFPVGVSYYQNN